LVFSLAFSLLFVLYHFFCLLKQHFAYLILQQSQIFKEQLKTLEDHFATFALMRFILVSTIIELFNFFDF
jgi:hypothetical protein